MAWDLSDSDKDLLARTVIGEANNQPAIGRQAVANVVLNRLNSGRFGKDMQSVLFAPKQFEPWGTRRSELMGYSTTSPQYQNAMQAVNAALTGQDPTNGATHFANVGTVADRGNNAAMGWLKGMSNVTKIGAHTFGNADGKGSGGAAGIRTIDTSGSGGGTGGTSTGAGDSTPDLSTPDGWASAIKSMSEPTDDPQRQAIQRMFHQVAGTDSKPDAAATKAADAAINEGSGLSAVVGGLFKGLGIA